MKRGTHPCGPLQHTINTLLMNYDSDGNIQIPEDVNREADRIEENPEAILRLVDLIWFLREGDEIPS